MLMAATVLAISLLGACSHGDDEVKLPEAKGPLEERGRTLVQISACTNCHTAGDERTVGPSWKGLAGSVVELEGGGTVVADDDYLRESITDPDAKIVKGYPAVMPSSKFDPEDLDAIVAYLRQLGDA